MSMLHWFVIGFPILVLVTGSVLVARQIHKIWSLIAENRLSAKDFEDTIRERNAKIQEVKRKELINAELKRSFLHEFDYLCREGGFFKRGRPRNGVYDVKVWVGGLGDKILASCAIFVGDVPVTVRAYQYCDRKPVERQLNDIHRAAEKLYEQIDQIRGVCKTMDPCIKKLQEDIARLDRVQVGMHERLMSLERSLASSMLYPQYETRKTLDKQKAKDPDRLSWEEALASIRDQCGHRSVRTHALFSEGGVGHVLKICDVCGKTLDCSPVNIEDKRRELDRKKREMCKLEREIADMRSELMELIAASDKK